MPFGASTRVHEMCEVSVVFKDSKDAGGVIRSFEPLFQVISMFPMRWCSAGLRADQPDVLDQYCCTARQTVENWDCQMSRNFAHVPSSMQFYSIIDPVSCITPISTARHISQPAQAKLLHAHAAAQQHLCASRMHLPEQLLRDVLESCF